jgi:hypothetical protein
VSDAASKALWATSSGHVGAAGEAALASRLLAEGFHVARPLPDSGVDLVVLAPDFGRVAPVQVKTARAPSYAFRRSWFRPVDVVLVICWLLPQGPRFFVFDGLADVERFLGDSARTDSWVQRGLWSLSAAGPAHEAALRPFENGWQALQRRLGRTTAQAAPLPRHAFRVSRHAQERIAAGEVREDWIAETLADPEWERDDPLRPGITLSWRRIAAHGGRALRVAHRPEKDQILVITAFFDRGATP